MQRLWFQLSLMKQAQLQTIRLIKEDCDIVRYCGMLEAYLVGNFIKEIKYNEYYQVFLILSTTSANL